MGSGWVGLGWTLRCDQDTCRRGQFQLFGGEFSLITLTIACIDREWGSGTMASLNAAGP